jgi:hypothetical protein
MTTTALSTAIANPSRADVVERAAQHMYDAEVTLHIARQSGMDQWVAAAYRSLHLAILEHTAALAARVA